MKEVYTNLVCKPANIKEARTSDKSGRKWYKVSKVIELSIPEYNYFRQRLLVEQDWLEGTFISDEHVVIVKGKGGTEKLAVDTQGYNYPRYVGVVLGER